MKRLITIALLFSTLTPCFAAGKRGHKGSHKPRHHRTAKFKPMALQPMALPPAKF